MVGGAVLVIVEVDIALGHGNSAIFMAFVANSLVTSASDKAGQPFGETMVRRSYWCAVFSEGALMPSAWREPRSTAKA